MTKNEQYLLIGANSIIIFTMIAIGLRSYLKTKKFLDNSTRTKGKVVELVYKGSSDGGGGMYSPKIVFISFTGQQFEFVERWSSNRPEYKAGDDAPIYYETQNPANAKLAQSKGMMFFVAYLVGGLGLLFLFIGIFVGVIFLVISITEK